MNAATPTSTTRVLNRRATLAYVANMGLSTQKRLIVDGLFPPGIPLGALMLGWFQHELDAWLAARARGDTDAELRALTDRIVGARKTARAAVLPLVNEPAAVAPRSKLPARPARANVDSHVRTT